MAGFLTRFENEQYVVYKGDTQEVEGRIVFDNEARVEADLYVGSEKYRVESQSAEDKDIVLRKDADVLFKFRFDPLWGGAELFINNEDTGYEVSGKLFMPGTRFMDKDGNELVVAGSDNSTPPVIVTDITGDEEVTLLMVLATIYYHIYTSASERFVASLSNVL